MAFGELKIVSSADIGELGSQEGTAIVYNWRWYYSIPGLALWVVLLGAIVLVKSNRNPRALLIVLPLLIVNLLWFGFVKLLRFPSSARVLYDPLFVSYTVGVAILWLLAHKLGNRNRFVTFLLALIIMVVVGLVGLASYGTGVSFDETTLFLMFLVILALVVLIGFVLAARLCQKHYGGLRFTLWLALWTVISSVAAMLTFMAIMLLVEGRLPSDLTLMLLQVLVVGLVAGLLLYAINLPFVILALSSPFFRERFYACLRLKSMPTATGLKTDADRLGSQSPDPATPQNSDSSSE